MKQHQVIPFSLCVAGFTLALWALVQLLPTYVLILLLIAVFFGAGWVLIYEDDKS